MPPAALRATGWPGPGWLRPVSCPGDCRAPACQRHLYLSTGCPARPASVCPRSCPLADWPGRWWWPWQGATPCRLHVLLRRVWPAQPWLPAAAHLPSLPLTLGGGASPSAPAPFGAARRPGLPPPSPPQQPALSCDGHRRLQTPLSGQRCETPALLQSALAGWWRQQRPQRQRPAPPTRPAPLPSQPAPRTARARSACRATARQLRPWRPSPRGTPGSAGAALLPAAQTAAGHVRLPATPCGVPGWQCPAACTAAPTHPAQTWCLT